MPPDVSPALRTPQLDDAGVSIPLPLSRSRLILHLGHTRSILLVYRDTSLVAIRSLQWGGKDIATALSAAFGFSIFEAMKVLQTKSFILMNSAGAAADQVKLSQTIAAQVDFLLKDLKLTLLEVKTAFNLEFGEIELMGGTCQIQNLGAYITQGLEIPANINLSSLARHPSRLALNGQIEAIAPVAVGLAIEGMKRPRNPAVNLRKEDFVRENVALKRFWDAWRMPVQVALGAFVAFLIFSIIRDQFTASMITTADEKLTEAAVKVAGIKGAPGAIETKIRSYIKTQRTIIKNQQELSQLDGYISAMDILARISEKMPSRAQGASPIDITLFDLDNETLTIRGKVASSAAAAQVNSALKDIAVAKSLQSLQDAGPGGFAYSLKVKRKE
jgi:general secretion pathway protein L